MLNLSREHNNYGDEYTKQQSPKIYKANIDVMEVMSPIIVETFNNLLLIIDIMFRQKTNPEREDLNNLINQQD